MNIADSFKFKIALTEIEQLKKDIEALHGELRAIKSGLNESNTSRRGSGGKSDTKRTA